MTYEELIDPRTLFKGAEEIEPFCALAECIEDLTAFLEECERYELYEYCGIIHQQILMSSRP